MTGTAAVAARLTATGRGAVATIRVHDVGERLDGTDSPFRAANGKPWSGQVVNRIAFGTWGHDAAEEVVVCRLDEHAFEIHCHGGDAAVERILADLAARGCEVVAAAELVRDRQGVLRAELLDVAVRATTVRTATVALDQSNGALANALDSLRERIRRDDAIAEIHTAVDQILRWAEFGRHLVEPWSVVLTGRPNVGKSSLINTLLGYTRSIVYDEPGTTRDVVTAETAFEGWPVRLADTAGLRAGADTLEGAGIELAERALARADCRLVLLDVSVKSDDEDLRLLARWPDAIVVAHKCDLPDAWGNETPGSALHVSSATGEGIDALMTEIVGRLLPEVPPLGTAIPVTVRQRQLLAQVRDEAGRDGMLRLLDELIG